MLAKSVTKWTGTVTALYAPRCEAFGDHVIGCMTMYMGSANLVSTSGPTTSRPVSVSDVRVRHDRQSVIQRSQASGSAYDAFGSLTCAASGPISGSVAAER